MTRNTIGFVALLALASCSKTETPKQTEAPQQAEASQKMAGAELEVAPEASPKAAVKASAAADPHAGLQNYGIEEVAALLAKKAITPVDANSGETRIKFGTLPGAILLSSSTQFELSELPPSKADSLVFYCSNPKCTAAPKAAKKASKAGYSNVRVMREGIKGWAKAGKKTAQVST